MFIKSLNLNMKLCSVRLGVSLLLFGLWTGHLLVSGIFWRRAGNWSRLHLYIFYDWSAPDVKGFRERFTSAACQGMRRTASWLCRFLQSRWQQVRS